MLHSPQSGARYGGDEAAHRTCSPRGIAARQRYHAVQARRREGAYTYSSLSSSIPLHLYLSTTDADSHAGTQENVDEERHVFAHASHGEHEDSDGSHSPASPSPPKEPLTPLMAKTSLHD